MAGTRKDRRPRTARRARERELKKDVRERERLVRALPGGSPERPLSAISPAVIEPSARSTPCHQCGGELAVDEHAAETHDGELLRVVRATCRRCGTHREIWFRLTPRLPQ